MWGNVSHFCQYVARCVQLLENVLYCLQLWGRKTHPEPQKRLWGSSCHRNLLSGWKHRLRVLFTFRQVHHPDDKPCLRKRSVLLFWGRNQHALMLTQLRISFHIEAPPLTCLAFLYVCINIYIYIYMATAPSVAQILAKNLIFPSFKVKMPKKKV